eukprot:CAMPEP_0172449790 /NCGR_PEP_ID=MMETSP1065-20121228/8397_1 /TAXON_ID=265537 /ORGANISM="Amphiprora paludosa, Strain CCMP125" /LENGTH=114 /DNA_ID=CAMNT_0013201529 /DNA_START=39 /DNA_END=383 /DNA_ORIENTATION=-
MTAQQPSDSPTKAAAAKMAVEGLLGTRIHCTLSDGRTATGRLVCVDRMRNLILTDCVEERRIDAVDYNNNTSDKSVSKTVVRQLQQAMVPGSQLVMVQISQPDYQAKVAPHLVG